MNKVQSILAEILNDPVPAFGMWKHYNCPACIHRGQSRPDTKKRGNHRFDADGSFSYNCYNCHLKIGWTPGRYMSKDMIELLSSFNASQKEIQQLQFIVKEFVESGDYKQEESSNSKIYQKIMKRELPSDAKHIMEIASQDNIPNQFLKVIEAIDGRNPYLLDLDLYWSSQKEHEMYNRFIIPYKVNNEIIGYTARHIDKNHKRRYVNQVSTSLFYNFDLLNDENVKTILVAEGPIDAALMGGISANNYYLSSSQTELLLKAKERGKKIVIVPDRDKDGLVTVEQALKHGFSVSFPDYGTIRTADGIRHIKDLDEACSIYGRLFCVQLIYNSIVDDEFYIKSMSEKWI